MNVNRRRFTCAAGLFFCAKAAAFADAVSELCRASDGFAAPTPGKRLTFPQDFGVHTEFRTEWWYLTANLQDASGVEYGVQWTLFRWATEAGAERQGWANQNFWMGHAAVTSASEHFFSETFARGGVGQAGVVADPFRAWIDDWSLAADAQIMRVKARGDGFDYSLILTKDKPIVPHGENGFSRKAQHGLASYYYSQPFIRLEGALAIHDRELRVSGQGWMDHEWGGPSSTGEIWWDWLSFHLSTGEKLMVFRTRNKSGEEFRAGTWIGADGEPHPLAGDDIGLAPLSHLTVANRTLPVSWNVKVKSRGFEVRTAPLNAGSWVATSIPYWEGPMRFEGSHRGVGYLEMTGY
jgi:predicted secreted hydrolase